MRITCAVMALWLGSCVMAFGQSPADNPLIQQLLQGQKGGAPGKQRPPHPHPPGAPPAKGGAPAKKGAAAPAAQDAKAGTAATTPPAKAQVKADPKAASASKAAGAAASEKPKVTAASAEGPPIEESDKNDPALLESVPTRELPEDASSASGAAQGELTAERVQTEFRLIDVNRDGTISYLEARDRNQIDLATFRRFDADNSGLLDVQEFEAQMVLLASSRGQAVDKTLKNRVDRFVDKTKTRIADEEARSQPSASAEKMFEYLGKKVEGLQSHTLKSPRSSIPRPEGLPPRSPRQPLHPGY
ncbi:MAG: EF-hand domain-containing protein [Planctomycetota bacterium]